MKLKMLNYLNNQMNNINSSLNSDKNIYNEEKGHQNSKNKVNIGIFNLLKKI